MHVYLPGHVVTGRSIMYVINAQAGQVGNPGGAIGGWGQCQKCGRMPPRLFLQSPKVHAAGQKRAKTFTFHVGNFWLTRSRPPTAPLWRTKRNEQWTNHSGAGRLVLSDRQFLDFPASAAGCTIGKIVLYMRVPKYYLLVSRPLASQWLLDGSFSFFVVLDS